MIESAFAKHLGLLNSSNKVDLVAQMFKHATSLVFCNLNGPSRSWRTDPKWYRQSSMQTLPPHVYPEKTKCCRGSGLVSRLGVAGPHNVL